MRLLFIGDSWGGSSARAVREALRRTPGVILDDIGQDLILPLYPDHPLRAFNRLLRPLQVSEFKRQIRLACEDFNPDIVVVYKGNNLDADFISEVRIRYAPVVNIFPDASPHAHGDELKAAMGEYDLVISAKRHHAALWRSVYGYSNLCVHVAQGYDPQVHLRTDPIDQTRYDAILVATWRTEYEILLRSLLSEARRPLSIAIVGAYWTGRRLAIPNVDFYPPKHGAAYVEWLRKAKIVIAPVTTVIEKDPTQPGDQVTDRSFQCAAAYTFFLHRRTLGALELYDEATEVPMYDDAAELAAQIERFVDDHDARLRFAERAHRRAVPAYSIDSRAAEIMTHLAPVVSAKRS